MPEEKKEEKTSKEEIKDVKVEQLNEDEKTLHQKSIRTRDDIKKVFIDNYGYTEGDPFLEKAINREVAHGKSMSKLIGQKIRYRDKYDRDIKGKENESGKVEKIADEDLQVMRKEASQDFIDFVGKDFPKLKINEVYEKVKEKYKETGEETNKEDFLASLKDTFNSVFPDESEKVIREDERKQVRKQDKTPDFSNLASPKSKEVIKEKSFFAKQEPIGDWFGKKY